MPDINKLAREIAARSAASEGGNVGAMRVARKEVSKQIKGPSGKEVIEFTSAKQKRISPPCVRREVNNKLTHGLKNVWRRKV